MDGLYSSIVVNKSRVRVCFYMSQFVKGSFHFCGVVDRIVYYGEPFRPGCTNDECCVGDESFSGRKSGTVGMSSKTCCATPRPAPDEPTRPCAESSARMTPCTRASCDGASSHVPLGPGAIGGADPPRPSQMHRRSFPGMIWQSRPVSM